MKAFLRMALLLGSVGACYLYGRWQVAPLSVAKTPAGTRMKEMTGSNTAKGKGPYFVTFADIQKLLLNPNISWNDKEGYLQSVLLPGIDPKNTADFIKLMAGLPAPPGVVEDKNSFLLVLFKRLSNENPAATLALLDFYPPNAYMYRDGIIAEALGNLTASDPQKAFSLLTQYYPNAFDQPNVYRLLFSDWAKNDPADAAAAALKLPGFNDQNLLAVGNSWSATDPQAAIKWAQGLLSSDANTAGSVINSALGTMAKSENFDKQAALNAISSLTSLSDRNAAMVSVATGMSYNGSPAAGMDWLNQNSAGAAYDEEVNLIFSNFDGQKPSSFLPALDKITDAGVRAAAIGDLATQWAQTSPTDALAWAQTLPAADATAQAGALNTILTSLSKTNPTAAAAFVQNATDPSAYLSAAPAIAQNLAVSDPQGALTWADNLPDGTGKDQALGNVLATIAQTDAASAWNAAASLPAGSDQDTVMTSIVTNIAGRNPAEAASLAEQMPDGSAQVSAISSVSATWVAQDPQAFATWMNGLPAGGPRDAAVAQLVASAQTAKDPATVLAWANSVGDPQARASEIATVVTAWAKNDPAAALNAAQTANLTDAQRTALIQKLPQAQAGGNK